MSFPRDLTSLPPSGTRCQISRWEPAKQGVSQGRPAEMKSGSRLEVISVPHSSSLLCLARPILGQTEN